jgi:hypothetical protein
MENEKDNDNQIKQNETKIKHLVIPHAPHFANKYYLFDDLEVKAYGENQKF